MFRAAACHGHFSWCVSSFLQILLGHFRMPISATLALLFCFNVVACSHFFISLVFMVVLCRVCTTNSRLLGPSSYTTPVLLLSSEFQKHIVLPIICILHTVLLPCCLIAFSVSPHCYTHTNVHPTVDIFYRYCSLLLSASHSRSSPPHTEARQASSDCTFPLSLLQN